MGVLEGKLSNNFVTTTVDALFNWGHKNSMWPLILGTACCGIEMMAVGGSRFEVMERWGMLFRFSPRHSDVLLVAGTVTKKMAPIIKTVYEQMPEPKWAIAIGSCAISGNVYNSYSTLQGVDRIIPVDIYVPGCPPIPEAIEFGIEQLRRKIDGNTHVRRQLNVINPGSPEQERLWDVAEVKRPGHIALPQAAEYYARLDEEVTPDTPMTRG